MERYYRRKEIKNGAPRQCEGPACVAKLSKYNEGTLCAKCVANTVTKDRLDILEFIGA